MTPKYPEHSIQSCIKPSVWWEEYDGTEVQRGCLIEAFLPHIHQIPYELIPVGRQEPTEHRTCTVQIEPLDIKKPASTKVLPVAALPQYENERWILLRAKVRPALVISKVPPSIRKSLRAGSPGWQTAPYVLVAPYYGAEATSRRAGFSKALVQRIRLCFYPHLIWDILPTTGKESILKLDHIQPVGVHHQSVRLLGYKLSTDAMSVIDEWLDWFARRKLSKNGILYPARAELVKVLQNR